MTSETIATAFHRLATGDREPPEAPAPWAYLSGLGIQRVSELAVLETSHSDHAGFDVTVDGETFRVVVKKLEKLNAGDAGG